MRGTAAWALGRIGGGEALAAVEEALLAEEDSQVRELLERALDKLLKREETGEQ
ncbi:hypothetical protein D3C71_2116850 [compost metagenome]